jgi:hypothetical protein
MISLAQTDEEIKNCYAVMAELRSQLSPGEFLPQVKRQIEIAGYQLAFLTDEEVKAIAGVRISESLSGGKYLEIEDLVSKTDERSKVYGGQLFDWLIECAKENDCDQIRFVSRVIRFVPRRKLSGFLDRFKHFFALAVWKANQPIFRELPVRRSVSYSVYW